MQTLMFRAKIKISTLWLRFSVARYKTLIHYNRQSGNSNVVSD
jgi:hypothetical protein